MERAGSTGGPSDDIDDGGGWFTPQEVPVAKRQKSIKLSLEVIDPEVVTELAKLDGAARSAFAIKALRLGVLAIRSAGGQLDAQAMQKEGERMLSEVRNLMVERGQRLNHELTQTLTRYLDPQTGTLPQKLSALTGQGGDLERLLKAHLGADDSTLARSLAASLGDKSPVFRLLSPNESTGLKAQLEVALKGALEEQRKAVVKEFSLDNEQSALSRLVKRVEDAQKQITQEFTLDNEQSALTRMTRMLKETSDQIDKNLTLDDENSALARLRRELSDTLAEMGERNQVFQQEVKTTLEVLNARKQEASRGTQHGLTFEAQLSQLLLSEAQKLNDEHEPVGLTTGLIKGRKIGDVVTKMGRESAAPGAGIVWEAKESSSVTSVKQALEELEQARTNRGCQLGVFVFSRKSAPEGLSPLSRYGNDLIVLWDAEDPSTDLYVRAAYGVARTLAVRQIQTETLRCEAVEQVEKSAAALGKHVGQLGEMKTWAETSKSNAEKIIGRTEKMQADLEKQLEAVNQAVASLKTES
jgi:hypothetical protein